MAGRVIRLTGKTIFDFNGLAANNQTMVAIAQRVDVSQFSELTLMVRAHSLTIGAGQGTLKVRAYATGETSEDPAQVFFDDSSATGLGEVVLNNTLTAPVYRTKLLSSGSGALIAVMLEAKQDATQALDLQAEVSVDLSVKE